MSIPQIRPSALTAWLADQRATGAQPVLLDVREPWECERASVAQDGSFDLIALPMSEIAQGADAIDRGRPVACLCHHGARSQRVAAYLAASGFATVVNVAGGIDAWSVEADPRVPRY